jgi:hypothetical protein
LGVEVGDEGRDLFGLDALGQAPVLADEPPAATPSPTGDVAEQPTTWRP